MITQDEDDEMLQRTATGTYNLFQRRATGTRYATGTVRSYFQYGHQCNTATSAIQPPVQYGHMCNTATCDRHGTLLVSNSPLHKCMYAHHFVMRLSLCGPIAEARACQIVPDIADGTFDGTFDATLMDHVMV